MKCLLTALLMVLFCASGVAQAQTPTPDPIGDGGGDAHTSYCKSLLDAMGQLNRVDIPAQEEVVKAAKEKWEPLRQAAFDAFVRYWQAWKSAASKDVIFPLLMDYQLASQREEAPKAEYQAALAELARLQAQWQTFNDEFFRVGCHSN